ncbi:PASTA domain-containing protein [Salipaludibacillus agaradhaerens]|uniref:PASTA domain-containing protein n=1 Tax=Salipaludibacillus agaradhaerens TaxID=76935 RepID=A0A9Q4FY72_SALAG|nr:PASTA domain-containing protein [Salipaludibacillus agaradhaerens]MCR6095434.1 PASTA domain-containing protein [Salipaludibacillus agaradhaerens]MCR6115006.1 PASTA domain-containing protein [Salipaludibacillus agaradhaerens]
MSDFLSKFNKKNYDDLLDEQDEKGKKSDKPEEPPQKTEETASALESESMPEPLSTRSSRRDDAVEELEIDPNYQKKRRRMIWLIILGTIIAFVLIAFIYYRAVHAEVEDFVGNPVSDARTWANKNDVTLELSEEYSMEHEANQIISQSISAGKKIRKGKDIQLVSSLGPDPEAVIPLPDFSEMNQMEAQNWIEENKAENLQLVEEYSDDVEEGEFLQLTIRESDIDASEYQRKDSAAVYYSRGKEVFEKNITIPDFTGKTREEVEQWAETNEIEMSYEEKDSNSVEAELIISQSESPEEKIAKRDKMEVVVSLGKATEVPNFGELTIDEATANYPELSVMVKQRFHSDVPYGKLISQSVEAGTKLTEKDDMEVTVTYSEGRPYLGDYRGQLEGDLPRLFYEEYQSKGADINYIVKYVDSSEVKGTVVSMSKFNEFVPMTYTVEIKISNNASAAANPPEDFEDEIDASFEEVETADSGE